MNFMISTQRISTPWVEALHYKFTEIEDLLK